MKLARERKLRGKSNGIQGNSPISPCCLAFSKQDSACGYFASITLKGWVSTSFTWASHFDSTQKTSTVVIDASIWPLRLPIVHKMSPFFWGHSTNYYRLPSRLMMVMSWGYGKRWYRPWSSAAEHESMNPPPDTKRYPAPPWLSKDGVSPYCSCG